MLARSRMIQMHGHAIHITIAVKNPESHALMEADRTCVHGRRQGMNLGTPKVPDNAEKVLIQHPPIALAADLRSNADEMDVCNGGMCLGLESGQKALQMAVLFNDKACGSEMLKEQTGKQTAYGTATPPVIEER